MYVSSTWLVVLLQLCAVSSWAGVPESLKEGDVVPIADATSAAADQTVAPALKVAPTFDHAKLEAVELATADAIAKIKAELGDDDHVLSNGFHFQTEAGEKALSNKMLRALITGDDFVILTQGTSVTAGHDDLHNESYPVVFGDTLAAVMAAGGVSVKTFNYAKGGTVYPIDTYCLRDYLGDDADVMLWEFNMIYFGEPPEGYEWYIRQVGWLILPLEL
jgi:hypothetical protein